MQTHALLQIGCSRRFWLQAVLLMLCCSAVLALTVRQYLAPHVWCWHVPKSLESCTILAWHALESGYPPQSSRTGGSRKAD